MPRKKLYRLVGYDLFSNFTKNKRSEENHELNCEELRAHTPKKLSVGTYQGKRKNLLWKHIRIWEILFIWRA